MAFGPPLGKRSFVIRGFPGIWSGIAKDSVNVDLETVYVTGTYSSLIVGVPNAQVDERIVARAVAHAQSRVLTDHVYLVGGD
jgi:hypothetical protein